MSLLGRWVERFFETEGFRVQAQRTLKTYRVTARPTHVHGIVDNIIVSISGEPDDFTLDFATGARSRLYMRFGLLTSLFGGGLAFLRGVKSKEFEERLERRFWIFVEEKIDFLASSAEMLEGGRPRGRRSEK